MRFHVGDWHNGFHARLPLGVGPEVGASCQWVRASSDLQQWKVDRRSAMGQSAGEDDPKLPIAAH